MNTLKIIHMRQEYNPLGEHVTNTVFQDTEPETYSTLDFTKDMLKCLFEVIGIILVGIVGCTILCLIFGGIIQLMLMLCS